MAEHEGKRRAQFSAIVREVASGYFIGSGGSDGVVCERLNGRKVLSISEMKTE